jgi:hypothetical protein
MVIQNQAQLTIARSTAKKSKFPKNCYHEKIQYTNFKK